MGLNFINIFKNIKFMKIYGLLIMTFAGYFIRKSDVWFSVALSFSIWISVTIAFTICLFMTNLLEEERWLRLLVLFFLCYIVIAFLVSTLHLVLRGRDDFLWLYPLGWLVVAGCFCYDFFKMQFRKK